MLFILSDKFLLESSNPTTKHIAMEICTVSTFQFTSILHVFYMHATKEMATPHSSVIKCDKLKCTKIQFSTAQCKLIALVKVNRITN